MTQTTDTETDTHESSERPLTLVFLHGSGDNAHVWDDVIARLPGVPCLALDLPGHGALADRPGPDMMSVSDYADRVRTELTRAGERAVCLIGHSLGGAIALRLAVDHPALVRRLALVGSGAKLRVLPALLEMAQAQPANANDTLAEYGFAPEHAAMAATYLAASQAPTAPGMLYRDLAACDAFDIREELGRVAQPTLILVGEEDRLTPPKYATYLRDHIATAQLVTIPGAGHYLPIEAPDATAQALTRWLASE